MIDVDNHTCVAAAVLFQIIRAVNLIYFIIVSCGSDIPFSHFNAIFALCIIIDQSNECQCPQYLSDFHWLGDDEAVIVEQLPENIVALLPPVVQMKRQPYLM